VREYEEKYANPYVAASKGYVDTILLPQQTREAIAQVIGTARISASDRVPRRHGNMPV
jgi:propionyl-CoA carboxylase beta chain